MPVGAADSEFARPCAYRIPPSFQWLNAQAISYPPCVPHCKVQNNIFCCLHLTVTIPAVQWLRLHFLTITLPGNAPDGKTHWRLMEFWYSDTPASAKMTKPIMKR